MAYCLRERKPITSTYKDLADGPRLSRWKKPKAEPKLYPVKILEEDKENKKVKVHYLGYGEEHDKWINEEDAVDLVPSPHNGICTTSIAKL